MIKRITVFTLILFSFSMLFSVELPKFGYYTSQVFQMPSVDKMPNWQQIGADINSRKSILNNISDKLFQTDFVKHSVSFDPVVYTNYYALIGTVSSNNDALIVGYTPVNSDNKLNSVTIQRQTGEIFYGSPIIAPRAAGGVYVYVLSVINDSGTNKLKVARYSIMTNGSATALINVPVDELSYIFDPSTFPVSGLRPAASLTRSHDGSKFVVTRLATTDSTYRGGIFILSDDLKPYGLISSSNVVGGNCRFTTPAVLTTIPANILYNAPNELPNPDASSSNVVSTNVEVLLVGGYYTSDQATSLANSASTIFLIPPTIVANIGNNVNLNTLQMVDGKTGRSFPIGNGSDIFRNTYLLSMRYRGNLLRLDFSTFEVMEHMQSPITLNWSQNDQGRTPGSAEELSFTTGYALHVPGFNTSLDSALQVYRNNQIIISTNAYEGDGAPMLKDSTLPFNNNYKVITPGFIAGVNVDSYTFNPNNDNSMSSSGVTNWRFYGNNFGPDFLSDSKDITDGDFQPKYWYSNFRFPVATGIAAYDKDLGGNDLYLDKNIYTIGTYAGHSDLSSLSGTTDHNKLNSSDMTDTLYAVNPDPDRYLRQTTIAALVTGTHSGDYKRLTVEEYPSVKALTRGARVLVLANDYYYDLGTITSITKTGNANEYVIAFTNEVPVDIEPTDDAQIVVSTSVPVVSHVQRFDSLSGSVATKNGTITRVGIGDTVNTMRVSEGILSGTQRMMRANPDMMASAESEVMVSFTGLYNICHDHIDGHINDYFAVDGGGNIIPFQFLQNYPYVYLPRVPLHRDAINTQNNEISLNYSVDARNGRILLSTESAGRFADRFVVVSYLTSEIVGNNVMPASIIHSEIMYIPSPIVWQYQFDKGIRATGGPTKIGDKLYVPTILPTANNTPLIYVFDAAQKDTLAVVPKDIIQVNATTSTMTNAIPYRDGFMVGTNAGAHIFSTRGFLLSDAQRVVRLERDGAFSYQLTGSVDVNPINAENYLQQPFNLITGIERLPGGNLLICDTGSSRIVECDRDGKIAFQYPASYSEYTLNGPRNVKRYDITRAGINYKVTLIADTGNNRIIEVYHDLSTGAVTSRVIAESADLKAVLGQDVTFTHVARVSTDSSELASSAIVVVLGSSKIIGTDGKPLRTLILKKKNTGDTKLTFAEDTSNKPIVKNAFPIKSDNDYFAVSQFNLVPMNDYANNIEWIYAEVVDAVGIKFLPVFVKDNTAGYYFSVLEDTMGEFKPDGGLAPHIIIDDTASGYLRHIRFTQADYELSLNNLKMNADLFAKVGAALNNVYDDETKGNMKQNLERFASDTLFAPTSFTFANFNNDINKISSNQLLVMQNNKMPNMKFPMMDLTTGELRAVPRIHLFRLDFNGTLGGWSMIGANLFAANIFMLPSPLSKNYPYNSSFGSEDYLTEPFSVVLD